MHRRLLPLLSLALLALLPALLHAAPLGSAFTYQGELRQGGVPVDAAVTLRFSLWDDAGAGDPPAGGTQIGASQTIANVPVQGGLFSVAVNGGGEFGAQAFDGSARWLQIEVCTDSTCASSTILGARQPLTATPYALGPWQLSNGTISYSAGRVGVGTNAPGSLFHVNGEMRWGGTATHVYSGIDGSGFYIEHKASTTSPSRARIQTSRNGDQNNYAQFNVDAINGSSLSTFGTGNGNFGIGTVAPTQRLDVRGSIKLGNSGEYFAPGASENLRIVRGYVNSGGTVIEGAGFTAVRTGTGRYTVTFSTAFPANDPPSVTLTGVGTINTTSFASLYNPVTTTTIFVRTTNPAGTETDSGFHFIAAGPR